MDTLILAVVAFLACFIGAGPSVRRGAGMFRVGTRRLTRRDLIELAVAPVLALPASSHWRDEISAALVTRHGVAEGTSALALIAVLLIMLALYASGFALRRFVAARRSTIE